MEETTRRLESMLASIGRGPALQVPAPVARMTAASMDALVRPLPWANQPSSSDSDAWMSSAAPGAGAGAAAAAEAARQRDRAQALQLLQDDSKQLWTGLAEIHTQLPEVAAGAFEKQPRSLQDFPKELDHKTILRQLKVARMRAELEGISSRGIEETFQSMPVPVLKEQVIESVARSVIQLRESIDFMQSESASLDLQIARCQEAIAQHQEMNQALQNKVLQIDGEDQGAEVANAIAELEGKSKAMNEYSRKLMKALGDFVTDYYPPLSQDDTEADEYDDDNDAMDTSNGDGLRKRTRVFIPLRKLLEELLNRFASSYVDPYIRVLPTHYPPYLELLVRAGIIVRHPQNANLIALTDFIA
ncbi:hypothetical protein CAOG_01897 [Capsaspora owczarzaki ATCC 30864]|uniref:hypothetical protein n=1 Tax=Capsaspora owczarzaki (strain ATCC 30864) TaxID=595528 RepID=UPI0003526525|nr:hypothetical protein CAOG_01897 [Capsaspora owczarzaki ATCC 30864]|eukprot:XP_004364765.2 hypothetical protein CAOG_01897 [Capsaspora owczarzaki ATCC 30864]